MSEQFTFDEFGSFNWNKSVSLKSLTNQNITMSQLSRNDFSPKFFNQMQEQQSLNLQEFNKRAQKKTRNKDNAKKFRERKKVEHQINQKRMKLLEQENNILKMQKYCKYCKKPYTKMIEIFQKQTQKEGEMHNENQQKLFNHDKSEKFQFEKLNLFPANKKQLNDRNGKIWIALGILMLVIGIHIYGFRGKEGYQDISISKIESKKWINTFQNKADTLDQYFNMKIKYQQKQKSDRKSKNQMQKQTGLFKQIRLYLEDEIEDKQIKELNHKTITELNWIEENVLEKNQENIILEQKIDIKFHKELLFAIQAEIDDLGNYM